MNKPVLYEPFDTDGVAHEMRMDNGGSWVHIDDYETLSCEGRVAFEAGYRSAYDSFAINEGSNEAEAEEHYQAMLEYDLKDYLGTVSEEQERK